MPTTQVIANVTPSSQNAAAVAREFRELLRRGARLKPAGAAKNDPDALLGMGYLPKHKIELFGATYYLTHLRRDEDFRFFVGYVRLPGRDTLYPRIVYKDSSLIWRSASHFIDSDDDQWIGKGDLRRERIDGEWLWASAEETTNLPYEVQAAFDAVSRRGPRRNFDRRAIALLLRQAPDHRLSPYEDFHGPRRRAMAKRANRINANRNVAWFARKNDPASLKFAPGFEPDLGAGRIDVSHLRSRLYGGDITKHRILARNRLIQYQFIAATRHVWIIPPQTLTTELMSYGLRTIDVHADERLCLPGYEFHYMDTDQDPPRLHSQIPPGFVGPPSELDDSRADTSPWNDRLPIIRRFRKEILGQRMP